MRALLRNDWNIVIGAAIASLLSGFLNQTHGNPVLSFVVSGIALAVLAALVGQATEIGRAHV